MIRERIYRLGIQTFGIIGIIMIFVILIFYSEGTTEIFSLMDTLFMVMCFTSAFLCWIKSRGFVAFLRENLMLLFIILGYGWVLILDSGGFLSFTLLKSQRFSQNIVKIKLIIRLIIILSYVSFYWKDLKVIVSHLKLKPAQSFSLGFISVILFGAFLLLLPISHAGNNKLTIVDALFTSTSAVCVTGLIVVDTATFFSRFGQTVIMLLIQVGGLGIMTLSAFIIIFSGSKMTLRERTQTLAMLDQDSVSILKKLVKLIILSTVFIEILATIVIYFTVANKLSVSPAEQIFFSLFHSISAFCNAGFSILTDSLMGFRDSFSFNIVIMSLIFFGGLGFPVLFNIRNWLYDRFRKTFRQKATRIQVQSRIILMVSIFLIIFGAVIFYVLEYANTLSQMRPENKVLTSLFQSVTTRTAGFNTIDIGALKSSTLMFFIFFMFIGASPSSTGGGVKVTTIFVLWLTLASVIRGRERVHFHGRTIPENIIRKAASLVVLSASLIIISAILIHVVDRIDMLKVLFETTSAFGTVGLSTGITDSLSTFSKFVLIFLMFFGRIGPLNILQAFFRQEDKETVKYPDEKIMIG